MDVPFVALVGYNVSAQTVALHCLELMALAPVEIASAVDHMRRPNLIKCLADLSLLVHGSGGGVNFFSLLFQEVGEEAADPATSSQMR